MQLISRSSYPPQPPGSVFRARGGASAGMAGALTKECIAMTKPRKKSSQSGSPARKPPKRSVPQAPSSSSSTAKTACLLALLSNRIGVSVEAMADAVGWQSHSIRGFLAGCVRKKLHLELCSEKGPDGARLYRTIQA